LLAGCVAWLSLSPPRVPAALPVSLRSATVEYHATGPGDSLVELRVVLDNNGPTTHNTSILWDPWFARDFTFVGSDPPAWRMRIDERGWGIVDTAGVLPHRDGLFRLWFAASIRDVRMPTVIVVVNGQHNIAATLADVISRGAVGDAAAQSAFEAGPLATAADVAAIVPIDRHGVFWVALAIGALLVGAAIAGGLSALKAIIAMSLAGDVPASRETG
jgi:hypothetical protein